MNKVNISFARQHLPELVNRVFAGEEFVIVKNKIPVAKIGAVKPQITEHQRKKRVIPGAFGMWKDLKGSTVEIADRLRKGVRKR